MGALDARMPQERIPRVAETDQVWFDEFGRPLTVKEVSIEFITCRDSKGIQHIVHREDWKDMTPFDKFIKTEKI